MHCSPGVVHFPIVMCKSTCRAIDLLYFPAGIGILENGARDFPLLYPTISRSTASLTSYAPLKEISDVLVVFCHIESLPGECTKLLLGFLLETLDIDDDYSPI